MKKIYIFIVVIIFSIISLFIFKEVKKINSIENLEYNHKETFKDELLENFVEKLEKISNENKIELSNFSLVKYDKKTYFKIDINNIKNTNYLIHYEGIDLKGIYINFDYINSDNIDIVEKIIFSAIKVSDDSIGLNEAKKIIGYIFENISKKDFVYSLKYKNDLVYTLKIVENGAVVFYVE